MFVETIRKTSKLIIITWVVLRMPLLFGQASVVSYTLDSPVSYTLVNSCNGETVSLSGTMHFDYHFQTDPSGNTNYFVTSTSNLTGTGTSGVKYVAKDSTNYHTVTHSAEASNFTNTEKLKLVSQGPTPNMMLRQQTHVVVDRSGNMKADTSNYKVDCK
jgi:hypothetical protein